MNYSTKDVQKATNNIPQAKRTKSTDDFAGDLCMGMTREGVVFP